MSTSRIVLINPPNPKNFIADRDAAGGFGVLRSKDQQAFAPLSLLYSAAVLEKTNFSVGLMDCNILNLAEKAAVKNCNRLNPDVIIILTSAQTFDQDCNFAKLLKERIEGATVVAIGPVSKFFQERFFQLSNAECGVFAEPEGILPVLLNKIRNGEDLTPVKGIFFRCNGNIVSTEDAPLIKNLEELPYPAWHLLPQPVRYRFTISSSRGCPHGCFYCPYIASQGRQYRYRNPKSVVDEMLYLEKRFNAKLIQFRDPIFTFLKERVRGICSMILDEGVNVKWIIETRPEYLDSELLELLAKAGCCEIVFGVESGSKRILKKMGRLLPTFTAEAYLTHVKAIAKKAKSVGIVPFALFMLGLPDEDRNSALDTINFAKELETSTQFSVLSPYPGTPFYDMAHNEGLVVEDDFSKMTTYTNAVTRTKYLTSQELENLVNMANREVWAESGLRAISRGDFKNVARHFGHFLGSREKMSFVRNDLYVLVKFLRQNSSKNKTTSIQNDYGDTT
jgi:radical SAM superfamily enzyme YgiQ (UPF0313 family)